MRISISGGAPSVERIVGQVQAAEEDGFTSIWFPGAVNGDPLLAMAQAASVTERIELGTAVLQTYPTHPVAMARRIEAAVGAAGRSLTIGLGPSHAPGIEGQYGHVLRPSWRAHRRLRLDPGSTVAWRSRRLRGRGAHRSIRSGSSRAPGSPAPGGAGTPHAGPGGLSRRRHDHLDGRRRSSPQPRGAAHQHRSRRCRPTAAPGDRGRPASRRR